MEELVNPCNYLIPFFILSNLTCSTDCPSNMYYDDKKICYLLDQNLDDNIISKFNPIPLNTFLINNNSSLYLYNTSAASEKEAEIEAYKKNKTFFYMTDCIDILKKVWKIPQKEDLYILKIESNKESRITNNIKYYVFDREGIILNLGVCQNLNINVNYYIKNINDINGELAQKLKQYEIDIYNSKDDFFNNICFNFTTDKKTDVDLANRRKDYFKNVHFCESNCTYVRSDISTKRVECICKIKGYLYGGQTIEEIIGANEEDVDPENPDFSEELTSNNYEVILCYSLVFNKDRLKINIGSFVSLGIIIVFLVFFFHYVFMGRKSIMKFIINNNIYGRQILNKIYDKDELKKNILSINNRNYPPKKNCIKYKNDSNINNYVLKNSKRNVPVIHGLKDDCFVIVNEINDENEAEESESQYNEELSDNSNKNKILSINNKNQNYEHNRKYKSNIINHNKVYNNISLSSSSNTTNTSKLHKKYKCNKEQNYENMSFQTSLALDKRHICVIYIDTIKECHILINIFLYRQILLPQVKISLFIVSTATDFFFNAFFYDDEYIGSSYEMEGELEFLVSLPKSIFSFICTVIFTLFLQYLTSSSLLIMLIKSEINDTFMTQLNSYINVLRTKIIIFYVISILSLLFFWYYTSAFCTVYQNSQMSLIKGTFISFGLSMLYPFVSVLFASVLRFYGLKYNSKILFYISKFLTLII